MIPWPSIARLKNREPASRVATCNTSRQASITASLMFSKPRRPVDRRLGDLRLRHGNTYILRRTRVDAVSM
ncbi:hypothetical protein ACVMAJ_004500 [Bradyrhizobium sp. USDA 4448]